MKKKTNHSSLTRPAKPWRSGVTHHLINIDHVAKLANLQLRAKEKQTFEIQLGEVLKYISKLNEIDTVKVEPIGHITGLTNITREDKSTPSISQQEALANAPKTHNGYFEVEAIFKENPDE